MTSSITPDLMMLRQWLEQMEIAFFECDSCEALHLPHLQDHKEAFDVKVTITGDIILLSAVAELRPTALIPLVADLSRINASSLTVKAFIDIQDDNLPKLVLCQTLSIGAGATQQQFEHFMQQGEQQMSLIMLEAIANELLFFEEEEEEEPVFVPMPMHQLH